MLAKVYSNEYNKTTAKRRKICIKIQRNAYPREDTRHMEQLIDAYFPEGCSKRIRTKIYCYIAVGGLLWSNWCEYKEKLGNSFMEYATHQYQYAKEYSYIALLKLQEMERTLHA